METTIGRRLERAALAGALVLALGSAGLMTGCSSSPHLIEDFEIEDCPEEVQSLYQEYEDGYLSVAELESSYYNFYNNGEITADELYTLLDMLGLELDEDRL